MRERYLSHKGSALSNTSRGGGLDRWGRLPEESSQLPGPPTVHWLTHHAMRKTQVLTGGQRHVPRLFSPQYCELEKLLFLVAYPVYGLLSHHLLRSSTSESCFPTPISSFHTTKAEPPPLPYLPELLILDTSQPLDRGGSKCLQLFSETQTSGQFFLEVSPDCSFTYTHKSINDPVLLLGPTPGFHPNRQ